MSTCQVTFKAPTHGTLAHSRGVPFDLETAEALKSQYILEISQATKSLVQLPEYAGLKEELSNPRGGESRKMKQALALHAATYGVALPQSDNGTTVTNRAAMREFGADQLPGWAFLQKLQAAKKALGTLEEYKRASAFDGRLHSLVNFDTVTGRTTSSAPSLQNVPRDPCFRGVVKAKPGHVILSSDYASIELRIAAALADRTVADLRERIKSNDDPSWFIRHVLIGAHGTTRMQCPPEPNTGRIEWLSEAIPAVAQMVLHREVQMMTSIFQRGLDPHLITAIDLARRSGKIDCGHSPVEWLKSQDQQSQKELKSKLQTERQSAKSTNFGLLYGMGAKGLHTYGIANYGLSWTKQEAAQAREAWFALYPEFRLWHWWTEYERSQRVTQGKCAVWNPYDRSW